MSNLIIALYTSVLMFNIGLNKYKVSGYEGEKINRYDYFGRLNEWFFDDFSYNMEIHKMEFLYSKESAKEYYGFIKDSVRAVQVAESVLIPIYGFRIFKQRPYIIISKNKIWIVEGRLPEPFDLYKDGKYIGMRAYLGGVFQIQINKKDGKILNVQHGK